MTFLSRIPAVLFSFAALQIISPPAIEATPSGKTPVSARTTLSAKTTTSKTITSANVLPTTQASPVAKGAKIKCWYFMQTNKIFGDCEVYVSPQALKVTFSNEKWANLAKPPDWDLFVFNPRAKVYCRTPLKEWRGRKLATTFVKGLKPIGKSEKIAGMTTKAYDAESLEPGARAISRIFVAENFGLPEQVSIILCGNAAIPLVKGIPLRVQHSGGQAPGKTVETHVAKQVIMPASFFEVPSGFRRVTKPEDVITGGISDIIEEMAR